MRKTLLTLTVLLASSLFANNADIKTKIENMPMIKSIGAKVNAVEVHNGVYQFKAVVTGKRAGRLEGFVSKDFKALMVGKAYNTDTGAQLSMPFTLDINELKSVAAYKMGNGKDEYFIFTDPECPYCQRLDKQLTAVKSNVTLYTILFPLNFHKNAKSMCRYILSQKDDTAKAEAMRGISNKSTLYTKTKYSKKDSDKYNAMIEKSLAVVNKIGINGTPIILNSKGIQIVPAEIIKR